MIPKRNLAAASLAACCACAALTVDALELTSPAFADGDTLPEAQVYSGFGCEGADRSPPLAWTDVPEGTKSFALTVFDPDAPTDSGWWHWMVIDLPANLHSLPEGAGAPGGDGLPPSVVQLRNGFGAESFSGACPPAGDTPHRYVYTLYALPNASLGVEAGASAALASYLLRAGAIERATLTPRYAR